jgi:hypothetical protein
MKKILIMIEFLYLITGYSICQEMLYSGKWKSTGNMIFARRDHTATLLPDGQVLITGWGNNYAEIYNPNTEKFSATGNLIASHGQGSTEALLNDGTVLIAGGTWAPKVAEIYDPSTGTFSLTNSLNFPHLCHTATLLPDGRVLIIGGLDKIINGEATNICELYNPISRTFTITDSLNNARAGHKATILQNGKVLITGGSANGNILNSAELYDPSSEIFINTENMNQSHESHSATLLKNGQVLIAGNLFDNSTELYDPQLGVFTSINSMNVPQRGAHTATLLLNGQVLVAGGFIGVGPITTRSVEVYDPLTETFYFTDSMITARQQHTATLLSDGRVLVTGGYDGQTETKLTELFKTDPNDIKDYNTGKIPSSFSLLQNFPNPFNPNTKISWQSPVGSWQTLKVYDVLGNEVAILVDEYKPAGSYEIEFGGHSDKGQNLSSGIYFYQLRVGGPETSSGQAFVETKKMILMK